MPESQLRLRFYRRMARIDTVDEVEQLAQEMGDRFGQLAEPVINLLYMLRLRALAAEAGIQSVELRDGEVTLVLPLPLTVAAGEQIASRHPGARCRGTRIWLPAIDDWQDGLLKLLRSLRDLSLQRVPG